MGVVNWNSLPVLDKDLKAFKAKGTVIPCNYVVPPNSGVILLSETGDKALGIFDPLLKAVRPLTKNHPDGLAPANKDLNLLYDHLQNKDLPIVAVNGFFGTGKTSSVMAHAVSHFYDRGFKLYLTKPHVPVGRSYGHLPGDINEKTDPEYASFYQYVERFALNQMHTVENLKRVGQIEVVTLEYVRGRDLPNAWIIVDEAQNLNREEAVTIASRVAEGSKLILLGDTSTWQIDHKKEDGFSYLIKLLSGEDLIGYTEMRTEGHVLRSKVAKALIRALNKEGIS